MDSDREVGPIEQPTGSSQSGKIVQPGEVTVFAGVPIKIPAGVALAGASLDHTVGDNHAIVVDSGLMTFGPGVLSVGYPELSSDQRKSRLDLPSPAFTTTTEVVPFFVVKASSIGTWRADYITITFTHDGEPVTQDLRYSLGLCVQADDRGECDMGEPAWWR